MPASDKIIASTKKWILDVVIGCSFCPFAAKEYKQDTIHYQVTEASDLEKCLEAVLNECKRLDSNKSIESTLLIIVNGFWNFEEYLELTDFANRLLKQQRYEGIYQIATFHPQYCFQGSEPDDAANYTNRSPYPILQLLREETIERSLQSYPNPERIPERNISFAREKGLAFMRHLLEQTFESHKTVTGIRKNTRE